VSTSPMRFHSDIRYTTHWSDYHSQCQRGCWSIIFTHPDDFVPLDLEVDRWLTIVRRSFAERRIQPLGLPSQSPTMDYEWVQCMSHRVFVEVLQSSIRLQLPMTELQAAHSSCDAASPARFVIIVDDAFRNQRTYIYRSRQDLPSPLDILEWADALRGRHASAARACAAGLQPKCRSWTECIGRMARRDPVYDRI